MAVVVDAFDYVAMWRFEDHGEWEIVVEHEGFEVARLRADTFDKALKRLAEIKTRKEKTS